VERILLTPTEAADLLGVSRTTVYDLIRSRRLDSVQIGRCRRIPRTALVAYVDRLLDQDTGEAA
jgi:excisionase family DNA binding protein